MKKSNNLIIAVAFVAALAIGFLAGISVESPRINLSEVSGTIGKVNNYRNTKATEADIELKNELLADTAMQKSVAGYMNFQYVRAIEFEKNIAFALATANANEAFKAKCGTEITALEKYGAFLNNARKDLLLAAITCKATEETDPAFLRETIAKANNSIAQINYRNNAAVNFIMVLDAFIRENTANNDLELNKAHDLLTYNQISSSILLKDKVLLKFFDKKKLYSKDLTTSAPTDFNGNIQNDMEQLGLIDSEKLRGAALTFDAEQLGKSSALLFDSEKLGIDGTLDAEKLGYVLFSDVEKLSFHWDAEKLGCVN